MKFNNSTDMEIRKTPFLLKVNNVAEKRITSFFLPLGSLLVVLFLSSCSSTTVLLSNFKDDSTGAPPATTQPTGTVSVDAGAGSVIVVAAPNADLPPNNWAQISHPAAQTNPTMLTGHFSRFDGIGKYALIASMFIPTGAGVATLQFETSKLTPQPNLSFFHLDFMPEGDVRIDDGATRFGQFPRDKTFVVQVNLDITATTATAEVTLLGGTASGNKTVNIQPLFLSLARKIGAVKFWMGFQHQGSFFVDDIVVTRKN